MNIMVIISVTCVMGIRHKTLDVCVCGLVESVRKGLGGFVVLRCAEKRSTQMIINLILVDDKVIMMLDTALRVHGMCVCVCVFPC